MTIEITEAEVTLEEAEEIRDEIAALDPGDASTEWEAELRRIVRGRRKRMADLEAAVAEKRRLVEQCDAIIREKENALRSFDWVFDGRARTLVACLTQSGKAKSVKTPWGTAGFRTAPARCVVADLGRLIESWGDHQIPAGLVRQETTYKPDAAGIQKHFQATGEG